MEKEDHLKDGTKIVVRDLRANHLDLLMKFYRALSPEDRKYLKFEVLDRNVVAKRLQRVATGEDFRVAALEASFMLLGVWDSLSCLLVAQPHRPSFSYQDLGRLVDLIFSTAPALSCVPRR